MRTQMFNTMCAFEKMANAVTDHLTADKHPCEQTPSLPREPGPGERSLEETFKKLLGVSDDRSSSFKYASLRAGCGNCHGIIYFEDYLRSYNSDQDTCDCNLGAERPLVSPEVEALYEVARRKRNKQEAQNDPKPATQLDTDLKEIRETLTAHHKALAILSTFAQFIDVGFFGTKPSEKIKCLIGDRACVECVGTGWLARDERCKDCRGVGYLKA